MSNIAAQLKNLNVSKLRLKNGSTIENELRQHAKLLLDCISEELEEVYESYTPSIYRRSYGLKESLQIGDTEIRVSAKGLTMAISVEFGDSAWHESFDGRDVNTAVLINEGWRWRSSNVDIPYFTRREGEHFIEAGIKKYQQRVQKPFAVKMHINDKTRIF